MIEDSIIPLPKEQWKGTIIPMRYTTEEYYDVDMQEAADGYDVAIHRKKFDTPVTHFPEEYDFPDKLYQDHWEKAYAWGIVEEKDGKQELLACIETCPEEWSNRLMVTELWVHEKGCCTYADGGCERTGSLRESPGNHFGNPVLQCGSDCFLSEGRI